MRSEIHEEFDALEMAMARYIIMRQTKLDHPDYHRVWNDFQDAMDNLLKASVALRGRLL